MSCLRACACACVCVCVCVCCVRVCLCVWEREGERRKSEQRGLINKDLANIVMICLDTVPGCWQATRLLNSEGREGKLSGSVTLSLQAKSWKSPASNQSFITAKTSHLRFYAGLSLLTLGNTEICLFEHTVIIQYIFDVRLPGHLQYWIPRTVWLVLSMVPKVIPVIPPGNGGGCYSDNLLCLLYIYERKMFVYIQSWINTVLRYCRRHLNPI